MANETLALLNQTRSDRVAEDDYRSFCAALGASARGRAFLNEYARRNRHADTEVVLEALARLERTARRQDSAPEAERIRQDLRALLDTLRSARPQVDSSPGAIKAATLAALIDFVQARIEALLTPARTGPSQVPELEQPELPIPQPSSMAPSPIALVQPARPAPADRNAQAWRDFDLSRLMPETRQPTAAKPAASPAAKPAAQARAAAEPSPAEIVAGVRFIDLALVKPQPLDRTATTALPALDDAIPATAAAPATPVVQQPTAPVVPTEAYEVWLDQPAAIQFDVAIGAETNTPNALDDKHDSNLKSNDIAAAASEAPEVMPEVSPVASPVAARAVAPAADRNALPVFGPPVPNPTGLSPRQLAIAALAAKDKPQQFAVTPRAPVAAEAPAATPAPAVEQPEAKASGPLSPRQLAIAALAAQNKAQQPATTAPQQPVVSEAPVATQDAAPATTMDVEQPATQSGPLSPRQAAIAALAAQNNAPQPAAVAPQPTVTAATPVATPTAPQDTAEAVEPVAEPVTISVDAITDALLRMQREAERDEAKRDEAKSDTTTRGQAEVAEAEVAGTELGEADLATELATKAEDQSSAADASLTETSVIETVVAEVEITELEVTETVVAETSVSETSVNEAVAHETAASETPIDETPAATTAASPANAASDPLDPILSLSDEERIALFT